MDADVKAKWLEALRSGEYEQATGTLKRGNGYCCLGVLCEVAVKNDVIPEAIATDEDEDDTTYYYVDSASWLPDPVAQWAGLGNEFDPGVTVDVGNGDGEQYRSLSALNDMHNYDFARIADVIENHL